MVRSRISELRDRQLNLSLTASELDTIRRRAEALGMRAVHFARAAASNGNNGSRNARESSAQFHRLIYGQLARLGNNLNQLMRYLHRTQENLPPDLEPLLADIRRLISRLQ